MKISRKLMKTKLRLRLYRLYPPQKKLIYRFFKKNKKAILVILDACRLDFFIKYINEFNEFDYKITPVISSGSCTKEWILNTFTIPLKDTVYIASNAYAVLVRDKFAKIIDVWDYSFDQKIGTVRAESINWCVKKVLRHGVNKIIAHYLQPHAPFVSKTWLNLARKLYPSASIIYELARLSLIARSEFIKAYDANMAYVIRSVIELLRWIYSNNEFNSFKVVITSDHGECLGREPIRYYNPCKISRLWRIPSYKLKKFKTVGHPCGFYFPELVIVPWLEINGFR